MSGNPAHSSAESASLTASGDSGDSATFETDIKRSPKEPLTIRLDSEIDKNFTRVLVIHNRSTDYTVLPITPSSFFSSLNSDKVTGPFASSERKTHLWKQQLSENLPEMSQQTPKQPVSILKRSKDGVSEATGITGKPLILQKATLRHNKSKPTLETKPLGSKPVEKKRLMATTASGDSDGKALDIEGRWKDSNPLPIARTLLL